MGHCRQLSAKGVSLLGRFKLTMLDLSDFNHVHVSETISHRPTINRNATEDAQEFPFFFVFRKKTLVLQKKSQPKMYLCTRYYK